MLRVGVIKDRRNLLICVLLCALLVSMLLSVSLAIREPPRHVLITSDTSKYEGLVRIEGQCAISVDADVPITDRGLLLKRGFYSAILRVEREIFQDTVRQEYQKMSLIDQMNISIFGFSEKDRDRIFLEYRETMSGYYSSHFLWQLWGLCNSQSVAGSQKDEAIIGTEKASAPS